MALTSTNAEPSSVPTSAQVKARAGSPALTAPLFFAGVFLVFLGERVLGHLGSPRVIATGLGAVAMLVATALRWVKGATAPGDRGRIERLLGVAQLVTCLAVALALLMYTAPGAIGLEKLEADKREYWEKALQITWVVLSLASLLPLGFAEAALIPMRRAEHPESRRVIAAASAGLAIALAVGYLGLFVGSARLYGVAVDYAYFKTAKPSTSTIAVARNLKEPVRIVAFFPALNEVRGEVERYLREVALNNPKVKVEFIDRVLQPKIAREMRVNQDGTVVLSRGEVRQMLNVGLELKNARATLRNFDQEFQKNLMKLARDARVAYVTIGHREINDTAAEDGKKDKGKTISALRKLLEMQNYRVQDLGMPQGLATEVPSDANVVLVLGPKDPFAPQEVAALKQYVARGGALLLALDAEALLTDDSAAPVGAPTSSASTATAAASPVASPPTGSTGSTLTNAGVAPNLNELAGLVGLSLDSSILANDRGNSVAFAGNKSDVARIVTNKFSSHATMSTLSRHSAWVVLFGTGSLKKLDAKDKTVDFALRSTATTFADTNRNFVFDSTEQRQSFDIAAAVSRQLGGSVGGPPGSKPLEQRSFVLADAELFSDNVLLNVPTNRFLLVDVMRWLGGEESLRGEVSSEEDVKIEHTKDKDVFWFYSTIFGMPALVLGLGLYLSRRSKGKGKSQ